MTPVGELRDLDEPMTNAKPPHSSTGFREARETNVGEKREKRSRGRRKFNLIRDVLLSDQDQLTANTHIVLLL